MQEKIKLVAVNYLNTKPFLAGLESAPINSSLDLTVATPANCADQLINGSATIGLVPVAMIPQIPNARIISDFCIGCEGAVGTVALFANEPIENINTIILDYQSRTSVQLLRLLVKDFWKKKLAPPGEMGSAGLRYKVGTAGYEEKAGAGEAVLVIGDRAMDLDTVYQYKYDLGEAWKAHTGLPFVFATWVSTKKLTSDFIEDFNWALEKGLEMIPSIIKNLDARPHFSLSKYYRDYISFHMDDRKEKALRMFLEYLGYELAELPGSSTAQ